MEVNHHIVPETENRIVSMIRDFTSRDPGMVTVYIFGSFGGAHVHAESDIDVAILFHQASVPDALSLLQIKLQLESLIGSDVDVVRLNDASPVICMQVLKNGRKIVEKNPLLTNEFFVRTITAYADLKIVRRPIEERMVREALHGRP